MTIKLYVPSTGESQKFSSRDDLEKLLDLTAEDDYRRLVLDWFDHQLELVPVLHIKNGQDTEEWSVE